MAAAARICACANDSMIEKREERKTFNPFRLSHVTAALTDDAIQTASHQTSLLHYSL